MNGTLRWICVALWVLGSAIQAQAPAGRSADAPRMDALGDTLPPGALMRLGSARWRTGDYVQELSFSPDGRSLASWHEEHHTMAVATLWDVATGREQRRIELPRAKVLSWLWLADGRGISVLSTSQGYYLWEFTDPDNRPPHKPEDVALSGFVAGPPPEVLSCFAISPDGKSLAAGKSGARTDKDRDIVRWELATQKKVTDLGEPRRFAAAPGNCKHLFFTPDGSKLVTFNEPHDKETAGKQYLLTVFNAVSGEELCRVNAPLPMRQGTRMSFALSARQLALGMDDEAGTVVLYDLDTGKESRFATGQGKKSSSSGYGVSAAAFSADGATLITAGRNSTIKVWDAITLKERHEIKDAYPGWIETLAVTRDGKRLACGGQGCMIRHFDVGSGVTVGGDDSHMGRVSDIAVTADGATAVTASADDHLRIWDVSTGRQQRAIRLELPESHWPKIALASDGRTVAVTVADKIKAWNVATGKAVPLPGQFADLKTANVRFAPNGKLAISLHADLVTLIEWPSGKLRRQFKLPEPVTKPGEASCDGAAISPDGRWLATVAHRSWYREERGLRYGYGGDGVLDLWNAATGERVHRLASGRATNRTVLFTADGDLLFVGGGDLQPLVGGSVALEGEFHLIDPLTGRLKQSFESAPRSPGASHRYNTALEISPDGRSIACAGNDGVIHVYEVATGKARRSLARHRAYVSGLAYTADGRRLLSASFDFTALAWDLSLTAIRPSSAQPPNVDQQTELWAALRSADAVAAYETMAALAAQPSLAVALIRRHIKPAAATPDDATLDRLAAALDDDTIVVREQATKELDGLGEAAVAGIRVRLAASPPPEARRRMLAFLEKHDPPTPPADRVREIRALEILEHLRDAESRGLLKELSQGARNARLTRMAATSLTRRQRLDSDPER